MTSVSSKLLSRKHSDTFEIEIHLFEDCNLSCSFCCQEHQQKGELGQSIEDKFSLVQNCLKEGAFKWKNFNVNLMGGELFQDKIDDLWFDDYLSLILRINSLLDGKKVKFGITTNLIFEKKSRVQTLLEKLRKADVEFTLNTSFDFAGRSWNEKQKEIFQENLKHFSREINSISVTLHKLSIKRMLSKRDYLFDFCYDNFSINFDWYVPDLVNSKVFHPSDRECKEALIYIATNYPNSYPIKNYLNQEINEVQCCSENRILIAANNTISSCQYLDYSQADFNEELDKSSSVRIADRFLMEQGCFSCDKFERCGLYCYVAADFSSRERNTVECFIKEFFKEVGK